LRLKRSSTADKLTAVLFVSLFVLAVVGVLSFFDKVPRTWAGIEYIVPAVIVDADGNVPEIEGLPAPSVVETERDIPAQLTRITDCEEYECPGGGIPTLISVSWQQVLTDGSLAQNFQILEDFEVSLQQNTDYVRGEVFFDTSQLTPFAVPAEVRAFALQEDLETSAWRIEGTVLAGVPNAIPVAWSTEVIHVRHGQEDS